MLPVFHVRRIQHSPFISRNYGQMHGKIKHKILLFKHPNNRKMSKPTNPSFLNEMIITDAASPKPLIKPHSRVLCASVLVLTLHSRIVSATPATSNRVSLRVLHSAESAEHSLSADNTSTSSKGCYFSHIHTHDPPIIPTIHVTLFNDQPQYLGPLLFFSSCLDECQLISSFERVPLPTVSLLNVF